VSITRLLAEGARKRVVLPIVAIAISVAVGEELLVRRVEGEEPTRRFSEEVVMAFPPPPEYSSVNVTTELVEDVDSFGRVTSEEPAITDVASEPVMATTLKVVEVEVVVSNTMMAVVVGSDIPSADWVVAVGPTADD